MDQGGRLEKKFLEMGVGDEQCWSFAILLWHYPTMTDNLLPSIEPAKHAHQPASVFLTNDLEAAVFMNFSHISCAEPPLAILIYKEILVFGLALVVTLCNIGSTDQNLSSGMWLVTATVTTWKQNFMKWMENCMKYQEYPDSATNRPFQR